MKKILSLVVAFAFVLSLAGCGSKVTTEEATTTGETIETPTVETIETPTVEEPTEEVSVETENLSGTVAEEITQPDVTTSGNVVEETNIAE